MGKHSVFMTCVGQVQESGCHKILCIYLYPKLRLRLQLLSLNHFQSMTITVFAAGFFALLGGVGGLKDCTMGDTDLFSDENEHLLFWSSWALSWKHENCIVNTDKSCESN